MRLVIVLVAIAALSVASCGGDDEAADARDADDAFTAERAAHDTAEQAIAKALLKGDCAVAVTDHFVRRSYGSLEGCRAASEAGALADSVRVEDVSVRGDAANAIVIPSGGTYDGVKIHVTLVRDPIWKVDELVANIPAGP